MNIRHPGQLKKLKFWPIYQEIVQNGLNWQCCLAGSSKTAPRIFIFSIGLGAEYSFYVKSIATCAPTFLGYNNSVLAIVVAFTNLGIESFIPSVDHIDIRDTIVTYH